jgi:hypothetical protein
MAGGTDEEDDATDDALDKARPNLDDLDDFKGILPVPSSSVSLSSCAPSRFLPFRALTPGCRRPLGRLALPFGTLALADEGGDENGGCGGDVDAAAADAVSLDGGCATDAGRLYLGDRGGKEPPPG